MGELWSKTRVRDGSQEIRGVQRLFDQKRARVSAIERSVGKQVVSLELGLQLRYEKREEGCNGQVC